MNDAIKDGLLYAQRVARGDQRTRFVRYREGKVYVELHRPDDGSRYVRVKPNDEWTWTTLTTLVRYLEESPCR